VAQQMDPQQIAAQAEQLRAHLEQASGRLDYMSTLRDEKRQALDTLRAVEKGKAGDEILFPVGGNTFVRANLGENKQVVTGVGADYAMPRPVDQAIAAIEKDIEHLGGEVQNLTSQVTRLEAEYTSMVQALQGMQQGAAQQ
jgi:prefoldin alpha subunit